MCKVRYWLYSRIPLSQPLQQIHTPQMHETIKEKNKKKSNPLPATC